MREIEIIGTGWMIQAVKSEEWADQPFGVVVGGGRMVDMSLDDLRRFVNALQSAERRFLLEEWDAES